MLELLKRTGWKSTFIGAIFSAGLILLESRGVDKLTLRDILISIEPLVLSFLIDNELF